MGVGRRVKNKGTWKIHKKSRAREREGWREKARGPVAESVCFLSNIRRQYCGFLTLSLFGLYQSFTSRISCRVAHYRSGLTAIHLLILRHWTPELRLSEFEDIPVLCLSVSLCHDLSFILFVCVSFAILWILPGLHVDSQAHTLPWKVSTVWGLWFSGNKGSPKLGITTLDTLLFCGKYLGVTVMYELFERNIWWFCDKCVSESKYLI